PAFVTSTCASDSASPVRSRPSPVMGSRSCGRASRRSLTRPCLSGNRQRSAQLPVAGSPGVAAPYDRARRRSGAELNWERLVFGRRRAYLTGAMEHVVSPAQRAAIDPGLDLDDAICRLKRERNAVLLAHYYQESEIQDLADFLGDSLQLAQQAKTTSADVILFAGVHFMAETAKILNPERVVVVPDLKAGCSLAEGCPPDRFRAWRARYPDAVAITYINCPAAVKADSDYICTSSNAEKIVRAVPPDKEILFAPDKNLGRWLVTKTGRPMRLWQ